jgi:hypothetical protein
VIVGASIVGEFTIDEDNKISVRMDDETTVEEAITNASKKGWVVGLSFPPHFDKDDDRFNGSRRGRDELM